MTALAANATKSFIEGSRSVFLLQAGKHAYQGGLACGNATIGQVIPGAASTGMVVLGIFDREIDNTSGTAGTPVVVNRIAARVQLWRANDGTISASNVFQACYVVDDQTVGLVSTSRTKAGTIIRVDATLGVLFELGGV